MVGELDAGNPHVQFDEGALETCDNARRLCPTLPRSPWLFLVLVKGVYSFSLTTFAHR